MKNKINDILVTLGENLDMTHIYKKIELYTQKTKQNSTKDINNNLKNINIKGRINPSLIKLKTRNFDSVIKNKKLKNINLIEKTPISEKIESTINNSKYSSHIKKIKIDKLYKYYKSKNKQKNIPISYFGDKKIFSKNFLRNILIIFFILGLGLFIDKIFIESKINDGYKKLVSIKDNSGDIEYIKKTVNDAKLDFVTGNMFYKPFLLIPNKNIKIGYHVIQGGENLTKLIDEGIQTYTATKNYIDKQGGISNIKISNLLYNLKGDFAKITQFLYNTIIMYDNIGELSDKNLNQKLNFAKEKLKLAYKYLDIINRDYDVFLNLLGAKSEKKYLILFQNNDEIRATGGFIGSLATLTMKEGKVVSLVNDDIYAYEWEVNKVFTDKEPAPEGLNKITDTFGLRDANYYIDFESSSKSINFFLNKINKKVDGIIYINQNLIQDFLKYNGGIDFSKLGGKITEDNFSLTISTLVEAQAFKLGTLGSPKQILFDFANEFFQKLKDKKDYYAYLDIILKNIKSRDLVMYSFNPEENNLLWRLGLNGKINYSKTLDFAYPVFTSIGGNKSDRYIELKFKKEITKNKDCSINTDLQIYRTHMFSKIEEKKVDDLLDKYGIKDKTRQDIINIQGKGDNKSYVRVVLPKDIIIEPKEGMRIIKLPQTTIVDFYITTQLLEGTKYKIEYKLINTDCKPYNYKIYKQPGIRNYDIEIIDGEKKISKYQINGDYIYNY